MIILDQNQVEDLLNHATTLDICCEINFPFSIDDGQGGTIELDSATMKIGLQYAFGLIGLGWPSPPTEAEIQDFMDQNDIELVN